MAQLILHKDGAYNLYTTVADGACYESALTLEHLEEVIRFDHGEQGMRNLPARLERAHKTGCSSMRGETLEECISCNRAGPGEAHMPTDEFIARYLTLPGRCDYCAGGGEHFGKDGPTICPNCDGRGFDAERRIQR